MYIAALILTELCMLLMAAHVLRGENFVLVGMCLVMMGLAPLRKAWAWWIVQIVLYLAAAEWLLTARAMTEQRIEMHEPYARAAIILLSVAGLNIITIVLRHLSRRRRFTHS